MGYRVAAFFDVDNTLINTKSMFSFLSFLESELPSQANFLGAHHNKVLDLANHDHITRDQVNRFYYRFLGGFSTSQIYELGRRWFEINVQTPGFYIGKTVMKLRYHQAKSHMVVFVSGSFGAVLDPIAEDLGVEYVLATDLEMNNQVFTGSLSNIPSIGQGKAQRVLDFSKLNKIDLDNSYAYGDDASDGPMLALVGNPYLVNPTNTTRDACRYNHKKQFGELVL